MTETRAQRQRKAKLTPAQTAVEAIRRGDFDDEFGDVMAAVQDRIVSGAVALSWRVRIDDIDVGEADLLLDEAMKLEGVLGVTWTDIKPLDSAAHASALLLLLKQRTCDKDEASEWVKTLTVTQVLEAITTESQVNPPKDPES